MNATEKWFAEQEKLRVEREARAKPAYFNTFDEYVKVYQDGEHWRHRVDRGEKILIATYEGQSCLDGDYYIAWAFTHYNTKEMTFGVVVNNGDDGYVRLKCASLEEAKQELEKLKLLAPFFYGELIEFGYYWD